MFYYASTPHIFHPRTFANIRRREKTLLHSSVIPFSSAPQSLGPSARFPHGLILQRANERREERKGFFVCGGWEKLPPFWAEGVTRYSIRECIDKKENSPLLYLFSSSLTSDPIRSKWAARAAPSRAEDREGKKGTPKKGFSLRPFRTLLPLVLSLFSARRC